MMVISDHHTCNDNSVTSARSCVRQKHIKAVSDVSHMSHEMPNVA